MQAEVNGERLVLDCAGAAWWPAERTLVFSDIHFEKGSSLARFGALIPPYDTRTALKRMGALIARYAPSRVIALGDSFHDRDAANRLDGFERATLASFVNGTNWVWIEGNHDPQPPTWLGGRVTAEIAIGGLVFRHEPAAIPQAGEIAGHLHPCATVTLRGHSLRRRCFASDGTRMVMPAFGAYAGGLGVDDPVISSLFAQDFAAYMLGGRRVYAVPARGTPRFVGVAAAR
ncbi:MAG: ligase-associated DNA damage response endonuclease PdeM [Alphaproteobacteria bacterium]|nr:ligase-associated DNA damage response endonuclease PdeM [Alphaproteobacteria bacterium]MBL6938371.1 ligase-associated DNA damage response endonuclease PdeM [Alphaproteobacteria bacterium]MBL7096430.1 ligase-associated DNA damage response endonuclease PdeM [Alphaproteobacteria bacterium]